MHALKSVRHMFCFQSLFCHSFLTKAAGHACNLQQRQRTTARARFDNPAPHSQGSSAARQLTGGRSAKNCDDDAKHPGLCRGACAPTAATVQAGPPAGGAWGAPGAPVIWRWLCQSAAVFTHSLLQSSIAWKVRGRHRQPAPVLTHSRRGVNDTAAAMTSTSNFVELQAIPAWCPHSAVLVQAETVRRAHKCAPPGGIRC